jgi:hypothetical protein
MLAYYELLCIIKVQNIGITKFENIKNPKTFMIQTFRLRDTELYHNVHKVLPRGPDTSRSFDRKGM